MKAIAAMSLNRVIGLNNQIPWHLQEDFDWFKQTTLGGVLLMGRKTFESIGKPLPGRETLVLTRGHWIHPEVKIAANPHSLPLPPNDSRPLFVCGGAEVYGQLLPLCTDLYLTVVKSEYAGDAFFPEFESLFELKKIILERAGFEIRHYQAILPRTIKMKSLNKDLK